MKTVAEIFKLAIDEKFYATGDFNPSGSSKYMCRALANMFRLDVINVHEMNEAREEIVAYMFSLNQCSKRSTLRGNLSKHITDTLNKLSGFDCLSLYIDYTRIDRVLMKLYADWNSRDAHVATLKEHHILLNPIYTSSDSGVEAF